MSDAAKKRVAPRPDAAPEGVGSGRATTDMGRRPEKLPHNPAAASEHQTTDEPEDGGIQLSARLSARAPFRDLPDDTVVVHAAVELPNPNPQAAARAGRKRPRHLRKRQQRAHIPAPAHAKLATLTAEFAAALQADPDLGPVVKQNLPAFRSDLERLVRSHFRLKRGRRTDPRLDAACSMVKDQGRSVSEVLRLQVKDYDKLDAYTRYLATKGLRQAVARRAGKIRKGRRKQVPPNPAQSSESANDC